MSMIVWTVFIQLLLDASNDVPYLTKSPLPLLGIPNLKKCFFVVKLLLIGSALLSRSMRCASFRYGKQDVTFSTAYTFLDCRVTVLWAISPMTGLPDHLYIVLQAFPRFAVC